MRHASARPVRLHWPPLGLALAWAIGLCLGGFGAGAAYVLYLRDGSTWAAVAGLPTSGLIFGALYVLLVRSERSRASDWLALGYVAAIIIASAGAMLWETLPGLYSDAVW